MKIRLILFFVGTVLLPLLILFVIIKTENHSAVISKIKNPQKEINMLTRKPAVAGSFYPEKFEDLASLIDTFLQKTNTISSEGQLKILVVPHAGLVFSGQTAAWGFKQIEGKNYDKIILLGASHKSFFNNAIVYDKGIWQTPLGETEIDEEFAKKLLEPRIIEADKENFNEEHSLEVELVFLQRLIKNFKIIPVLLGKTSEETIKILAQRIAENFDDKTLLVISTDLSHYPDWETANIVDNKTIEAMLSGKVEIFEKTIQEISKKNYHNLDTCACGQEAVKVGLMVAEKLKINDFTKIFYENSGDVSEDKSRVVGYTAIGGWEKDKLSTPLDKESEKEALEIARNTLGGYLEKGIIPKIIPKNFVLNENLGAFVTLKNNGQLRGCIGLFEPDFSLSEVIQKMTVAAATEDSRFISVTKEELTEIEIEISVMTPKKKIDDWKKIKLGVQGVVIKNGFHSGTFLPQVATETGWTLEEFLSQLCSQKAGLNSECYKDSKTEIFTFEAQVFSEE